ncbi:hypothetical protein [Nonomuraea sp. SBT364]|uniref:hypothetical protein n=1 Tax=Nonomuraea sp. SBT364 TaxID=1580530 RepID=UPI00066DCEC2|nr:hypothetical protein [Nonomuraea sp. SBT364]
MIEQPTRRAVLRTAARASVLLGAGAALAVTGSPPARAAQLGWRWCARCSGLWYSANGTRGSCPAGDLFDGGHHSTGSGDYVIKTIEDGGQGQTGWRWCGTCQGLWYGGGPSLGHCPGRGSSGHWPFGPFPVISSYYVLEDIGNRDGPGGQEQWRWCVKCGGLFFDGNSPGASGRCPKDNAHHSVTGGSYVLRQTP